ncbi:MAG TPA: WbuC family cupin fold metalloprotein [Nitrospirota bacterium]|nr:WbuC family cupin fold metalloprotein [Nitrospirota bacterium]
MKKVDAALLDDLTSKAKASPRKRAHFNLHPELIDPVQRLCVAVEPETYIRPHRHADPAVSEVFLLLRGSVTLLFFDEEGMVVDRSILSASGPVLAAEIPANMWHTAASLEKGTVFFEIKQGPYVKPSERNSAAWAPPEGDPGAQTFVQRFKQAKPGDSFK